MESPTARSYQHKMKVVTLVEMSGRAYSLVIDPIIKKHLRQNSNTLTDAATLYQLMNWYSSTHGVVWQSSGKYGRGEIHPNAIKESFPSLGVEFGRYIGIAVSTDFRVILQSSIFVIMR